LPPGKTVRAAFLILTENEESMKKSILVLALFTILAAGASAQMSINAANLATFNLKTHTTVGADLQTGIVGMETVLDDLSVWFEIFPEDTRGISPSPSDKVTASIRVDGSKYALKWSAEPFRGESYADKITAELLYRNYWFRIKGTEPELFTNSASLRSIFDDVIDERQNSPVPVSLYDLDRNLVNVGTTETPITGMLSAGADLDYFTVSVRVGSKGTWETNEDQAWVFGGDLSANPAESLTVNLTGLGTVNYDKSKPGANILSGGVSVDYLFPLTDMLVLKPYIGFDDKYETVSEINKYEIGGGVFLYWHGAGYTAVKEEIHPSIGVPVGLSLSANVNNDKYITVMFSLSEEARPDSLIPNFGGFVQAEIVNLDVALFEDRALACAGQIEYLVKKTVKPYLFGKFIQGYEDGKLTETDSLTSRAGILFSPVAHFTLDLRYERTDTFGLVEKRDNGVITSTFSMKL